jgi:hypothetical protein
MHPNQQIRLDRPRCATLATVAPNGRLVQADHDSAIGTHLGEGGAMACRQGVYGISHIDKASQLTYTIERNLPTCGSPGCTNRRFIRKKFVKLGGYTFA